MKTPEERDAEIIAAATEFTATVFLGAGVPRVTARLKTLTEARDVAVELNKTYHRPVGIYAVRGNDQAHVENYPKQALYMSAKDRDRADRLKKIERGE